MGRKEFLKRQMPKANVVSASDDDAAIQFLIGQKLFGGCDLFVCRQLAPLGGNGPRDPMTRDLDLAAVWVILHRQRQFLQQADAAFR